MKIPFKSLVFSFVAFYLLIFNFSAFTQQDKELKKVLVLNSYHRDLEWTESILKGLKDQLNQNLLPFKVDLQIEYLDFKRETSREIFPLIKELFMKKFIKRNLDLVIVSDNPALEFAIEYRKELFGKIPIVFCGINNFNESLLNNSQNVIGVVENNDIIGSINIALDLHPFSDKVIIITDVTETGKANTEYFYSQTNLIKKEINYRVINSMSLNEIVNYLNYEPDKTIVLLFGFFYDEKGNYVDYKIALQKLRSFIKQPIYSVWDFYLGYGIIGGKITKGYDQGYEAGKLALRILAGENLGNLPLITETKNYYMFDLNELRRFNIPRSSLPPESQLINESKSFFILDKNLLFGIALIISLLLSIIAILIINNKKRKAIEKELDKFKKAIEQTSTAIVITDLAANIVYVNKKFTEATGYSPEEILGKSVKILRSEEMPEIFYENIWTKIRNGETWKGELLTRKKDGEKRWEMVIASPILNEYKKIINFLFIREDITEKKKALESLKENEYRYRTLFNNAPYGIVVRDLGGRIIEINQKFCEYFNSNYDAFFGKTLYSFFPSEYAFEEIKNLKDILQGNLVEYQIEAELNNQKKYFNIYETKIPISEGSEGVISIVRDITDRINYERELIKAKQAAEKSDKLKSEFLSIISHEIKTPLNAILNFMSLIKSESEEYLNDDIKKNFRLLDEYSRRITRTIDLLLNFSELNSNNYEPHFQKFNLYDFALSGLLQEFKNSASIKGLYLNFKCECDDMTVYCDPYSVKQILSNVIDNSIKFTENGGIDIICYRNHNGKLTIDIIDTGIGISKDFQKNIFMPFAQEDSSYNRKYEGNGLGLALAKKFADLNRIDILITSEKNIGTKVSLVFQN